MNEKKSIKEKWHSLSLISKIQFVSASVLTAFLLVAVPVYAWFTLGNDYETLTKVKEPEGINIRAGNDDPIINFDLSGIDIESIKENGSQDLVFGVKSGSYKTDYDLLLAHTTNIPLTYKIYTAAKVEGAVDANNVPANYVPYVKKIGGNGKITYYQKVSELSLVTKNAETDANKKSAYGRTTALDLKTVCDTYDSGDEPELYAIPIYMQTAEAIHPSKNNDINYFILELGWDGDENDNEEKEEEKESDGFSQWNIAVNNKETDMIYITAHNHTS